MEGWQGALRKLFPGGPLSVGLALCVAAFLFAIWFFGWNKPSRGDLEGLLYVSFATSGPLTVWNSDGSPMSIDQQSVASVGEIRCRSESKRRQPSIRYYCLYDLVGPSQAKYRRVLGAEHNRGWARNGMADFGNYRLLYLSPEQQQAVLAHYQS